MKNKVIVICKLQHFEKIFLSARCGTLFRTNYYRIIGTSVLFKFYYGDIRLMSLSEKYLEKETTELRRYFEENFCITSKIFNYIKVNYPLSDDEEQILEIIQ